MGSDWLSNLAEIFCQQTFSQNRGNDFDQFEQRPHVYDAVCYNGDFFPLTPTTAL